MRYRLGVCENEGVEGTGRRAPVSDMLTALQCRYFRGAWTQWRRWQTSKDMWVLVETESLEERDVRLGENSHTGEEES